MTATPLSLHSTTDLPEYPFGHEDRLDSHFFIPWHRQRWMKSDMRLHGLPECRAFHFDLIVESYDHTPIGTLPTDHKTLAKILMVEPEHFANLCRLPFGPLHKWERCLCGNEVRLMHPYVVKSLVEAMARKEDNRARNEAATAAKRLQRLRITLTGLSADLAKNDFAVRFVDDWLDQHCTGKRTMQMVQQGLEAWMEQVHARARSARP